MDICSISFSNISSEFFEKALANSITCKLGKKAVKAVVLYGLLSDSGSAGAQQDARTECFCVQGRNCRFELRPDHSELRRQSRAQIWNMESKKSRIQRIIVFEFIIFNNLLFKTYNRRTCKG